MEGHEVGVLAVDTLYDVNFTIVGPVVTQRPALEVSISYICERWGDSQSRPYTTDRARHVCQVDGDKHVSVRFLAADSYRTPARARCHIGVIDAHVDCVSAQTYESIVLCSWLVYILDEAVCGITASEEVHLVEEIGSLIIVHEEIV